MVKCSGKQVVNTNHDSLCHLIHIGWSQVYQNNIVNLMAGDYIHLLYMVLQVGLLICLLSHYSFLLILHKTKKNKKTVAAFCFKLGFFVLLFSYNFLNSLTTIQSTSTTLKLLVSKVSAW